MKTAGFIVGMMGFIPAALAQDPNLPSPVPNLQTLPANSYIIAMDNTHQQNSAGVFNYKAYGLIVHLLNNNTKVKWVITAGKAKDATDISVNAIRIKPTLGSNASFNFKAGPFVIFSSDTAGVASLVENFNSAISNANDKVKIYRTTAATTVDIRYDLTGFIPKAAVLTDGGNQAIHMNYFAVCNVPSSNYMLLQGIQLATSCFTFASEPHNSRTGQEVDEAIAGIKTFVQMGGNFLAQCEAVQTYENSSIGRFQTTTGITDANSTAGTAISYPNPDLSFSQFEGSYSVSKGGSLQNWRINATGTNNYHSHARATADNTVIGASVSKHYSGPGGLVFYIGNHRFDDQLTTLTSVNGLRMYMNAFLTPAGINNSCNIGEPTYLLPTRLLSFYGTLNEKKHTVLSWKMSGNESVECFEVQRKIHSDFKTVAFVLGSHRPGEEMYSFRESVFSSDTLQYRLKIIYRSQKISYSGILFIHKETTSDLPATPQLVVLNNPVHSFLRFRMPANSPKEMNVSIMNITGQKIWNQKIPAAEANRLIQLPLPAFLQRGMYVLCVQNANTCYRVKFDKL